MTVRKPLDICIVTCDTVGPIKNGGIGTAYYSLARMLAAAGHRVTLLYALGQYCENQTIDHWRDVYAGYGISFVALPEADDVRAHSSIKISVGIYRWLRKKSFDVVHFHEWRGIAFYSVLAKRQGLALANAVLCVGAHSPVLWHKEGMNELATLEDLETDFMERESVALADVLWSPSRHMVAWMRREGWRLPQTIVVKHYVVLDAERASGTREHAIVKDLVFFGRLETRKGLDLFCDALDRLVRSGVDVPAVTFLGKPAVVGGTPSEDYLRERARTWPFPWKIVRDFDRAAAIAYLREPGRLAVLPSRLDNLPYTVLECLTASIPFVASNVGGIPEMVRDEDRARVLFPLDAERMAQRLEDALTLGFSPAPPRVDPRDTDADWLEWHTRITRRAHRRARTKAAAEPPLVTVCITHYNRPEYLRVALDSIRRQDYPRIQVVLVDDGSDREDAVAFIDDLEPEFRERGWSIVRQPNRYLGAARNAGIRQATGRYVLFMDDDNMAEPHEISTFVHAAETSGADILTCFLRVFQGSPTSQLGTYIWPFLGGAVSPGLLRNVFGDANSFIRRDVFDRIGGFTEDVGIGWEDYEFFGRAVLKGLRLMVVPEPLVRYRQSVNGMLNTTSHHANRMRALRPYFALVTPSLRGAVHLVHQHAAVAAMPEPTGAARLDHVRRAVVFGTGEAGRRALKLASRCGWDIEYLVDNNPEMWLKTAHGYDVRPPTALGDRNFDVILVASLAGKQSIFSQLEKTGLTHGEHFVHFLEPISVGDVTVQMSLS